MNALDEGLRLVKSSGPLPAKSAFILGEATSRFDGFAIDLSLAVDPPLVVGFLLVIELPAAGTWRVRVLAAVPLTMIPA